MSASTDIPKVNSLRCGEHMVAQTLWRIGREESELVQMALAWVIRNRVTRHMQEAAVSRDAPLTPITRCAIEAACEEVIAEAAPAAGQPYAQLAGFEGKAADASGYTQVQEVAQQVWRGDFSDPTGGATRCCRHDKAPLWPPQHPPLALLGSFLFYP